MSRIPLTLAVLIVVLLLSRTSRLLVAEIPMADGEETSVAVNDKEAKRSGKFNLALKTGGGTQLWTDHQFRDGYRIQQNALTGHWRLLDPKDVRRAWGSRSECELVLEELHPSSQKSVPEDVVVLLHGLMRTRHCMKSLETRLQEEGYPDVIRFSYASSRRSIADHARALREVLEDLPEQCEIRFIAHSMGNIVVRHLVGDLQRDGDPKGLLPRFRAIVMLGPPNQGAAIARRLAPSGVYGLVTGKGGLELGPKWDEFVQHLATPPFPFAIIAGDLSKSRFQNPLVEGSSDYLVSVEEAKLEGAESFETLPVVHSYLMSDAAAQDLAIDFVKSH